MLATYGDTRQVFRDSCLNSVAFAEPFPYFRHSGVLPVELAAELGHLPLPAPPLPDMLGKREYHNKVRSFFDAANMAHYPAMRETAELFQDRETARLIAEKFHADIDGTFVRLEYAIDVDGFWLEPHTDLGTKKYSLLVYVSDEPGQENLGTDLYSAPGQHHTQMPFKPNHGLCFVPSDRTWHGFEARPIKGLRKSVILNYVTSEWRTKEQLSFPDKPVRV